VPSLDEKSVDASAITDSVLVIIKAPTHPDA